MGNDVFIILVYIDTAIDGPNSTRILTWMVTVTFGVHN